MSSIYFNAFSRGAKASSWKLKQFLSTMYKIFGESPSARVDYGNLTSATEKIMLLSSVPICGLKTKQLQEEHETFGLNM